MFMTVTASLAEGFLMTLKIFALTLLFALPLGLVIAFGSMSKFKPLKWLVKILVWIIRGTPLMLQLILIYYGPGLAAAWAQKISAPNFFVSWIASWSILERFTAVMVAFVILMQVVKRIIPPMSNEIITLVKDTSLARVIAVYELIWNAQTFIKLNGIIWPLFFTGVFYLAFSGILTLLFGFIEKKLDYYHA